MMNAHVAQGQAQRLVIDTVVEGRIAAGGSQRYTFDGVAGEMISVLARGQDGLDVALTISMGSATLLDNDDYDAATTRDALLEGVTLPRTGPYTLDVQSVAGTTGAFTLSLRRGYADVAPTTPFDRTQDWALVRGDATVRVQDASLILTLAGPGESTVADMQGVRVQDAFSEVGVEVLTARGAWEVGFVVRMVAPEQYIQATVNERGLWRLIQHEAGREVVLRDWISHPALVPGQTSFRLGVLSNGAGLEVFYNGSPLGSATGAALSDGVLGFTASTRHANGLEVAFRALRATVPYRVEGASVLPQRLTVGDAASTILELQRRRLVTAGGTLALTVPTSSGQATNVGVSRLPLGRGVTYNDLAIASTVTLGVDGGGPGGCGLVLRATDDTSYLLAFVDSAGGLGLSARAGNVFAPSLFDTDPAVGSGTHHLMVVARGDVAHLYVDGVWRGTLSAPFASGGVGNALVNFEPANTRCTFTDTWVYRMDGAPS